MSISDDVKLRCFDAVFAAAMGGPKIIEMMVQYHVDGMSYEDIGTTHNMTPKGAFNCLGQGRKRLRECGLWPVEWVERRRGRRKTVS